MGKKVLEKKLDQCPDYSYYCNRTIDETTMRIDGMITNDFLQIDYNSALNGVSKFVLESP
jgi:hypothetical protein